MEVVLWIIGGIVGVIIFVLFADQIYNLVNNNEKCFMCWGSEKCKKCIFCIKSDHCYKCYNCRKCEKCSYCTNCISCRRCTDCINCVKCKRSHWCENCENCQRAINCDFCTDCFECTNCKDCIECRKIIDIKAKPGRKLGNICGDDCSKCEKQSDKCKYVPMYRAEKIIEKY